MKTIQEFLAKHTNFYVNFLDNQLILEVDCRKRKRWVEGEEEKDIKELGFVNLLDEKDYAICCCGVAMFVEGFDIELCFKNNDVSHFDNDGYRISGVKEEIIFSYCIPTNMLTIHNGYQLRYFGSIRKNSIFDEVLKSISTI